MCKPLLSEDHMMWAYNRLRASVSSMSTGKWRRVCFAFITVFIFFGYIAPWLIHHTKTSQMTTDCMTLKVEEIKKTIDPSEAAIIYPGKEDMNQKILPFIGNGNIVFLINHQSPHNLRLKYEMSKTVMAPYRPMVKVLVQGYNDKTLYVVNYKKGKVERIQCYFVMDTCVWLNVTSFIHRTRPSLFYEILTLENKSPLPLMLEMNRNGPYYWKGSGTSTESFKINGKEYQYSLSSGRFATPNQNDKAHQYNIALVVAATAISKLTEVPPQSIHQIKTQTLVKFSEPFLDANSENKILSKLVDSVEEDLFKFLAMDMAEIEEEHLTIWSDNMWNSNLLVEVDESHLLQEEGEEEKAVLTTELGMATVYYLLSSVPAHFLLPTATKQKKKEMIKELQKPTSCFNGLPTFNNMNLWKGMNKETELNDLISHWVHVLYKHGCAGLLTAGTQGVNQAVMLSFLGGQFADKELSFHADPSYFDGRYQVHNLLINSTFVDIRVDPRLNKQTIQVRMVSTHGQKGEPAKLYVCEAGCATDPKELNLDFVTLELRWTEPSTPFLYISHSKEHLIGLRKIIHISKSKRLDEIPPVKGDSTKREPFHIPVFFWVAIISMIILFHMFLIKLIYNEYCSDNPSNNRIISWKGSKESNKA